jgi:hypothetical protein
MPTMKAQIFNRKTPIDVFDRINWYEENGTMKLKPTVLADILQRIAWGEVIDGVELIDGDNGKQTLCLFYIDNYGEKHSQEVAAKEGFSS